MTGHVIDFKLDGTAEAMHNDKFDLSFLGKQAITRATDIVFNELTQSWQIQVPSAMGFIPICNIQGEGLFEPSIGFVSYETARQVEIAWLNECRLRGFDPVCVAGLEVLRDTRTRLAP